MLDADRHFAVQGVGSMGGTVIESVPRRIPFAAIDAFARRFEISGEAFDRLLTLVGILDREYLQIESERSRQRWERRQS